MGVAKSEEMLSRRQGQADSQSFRSHLFSQPFQGGSGDLLSQFKNLGGAVEIEVGGARDLWRAVLPANWREMKKKTQGRTNHGSAAGDDFIQCLASGVL